MRNLRVYFGDGTIAGTGDATWHGRTVHVTVRSRPVVSDGGLRIEVLEVRLGRLPAPGAVYQQARDELNRGIGELTTARRIRVESVHVSPGVMTITGQVGGQ